MKNKLSKIVLGLLSLSMCLSLFACGGNKDRSSDTSSYEPSQEDVLSSASEDWTKNY